MTTDISDDPPVVDAGIRLQKKMGYWESRRHMLYYKAVFQYVSVVGYDAKSLIDVGAASSEYVQWMSWIPERSILDFKIPRKPEGITAIETDFFDFNPPQTYDVAMCCQVLEHVPDPAPFCEKLKSIAKHLVISVPHKWLGNAPGHIHDPVDEEKLAGWMKLRPNNSQVVQEPFREARLIAYYDLVNGPAARFDKEFIFRAIAERAEHAP